MSLINEALKRARDASFNAGTPPPVAPGYRIEGGVQSGRSKGALFRTILLAVVVLAIAVVIVTRVANLKGRSIPNVQATIAKTKPSAPALTPEQAPSTPAVDPKVSEDQLVARLLEKIKAEQAAAAPKLPKLVLQGITYAPDGSEVMINGMSLREGAEIEGARVVAIDRRSVKLDFSGSEIVLRLP